MTFKTRTKRWIEAMIGRQLVRLPAHVFHELPRGIHLGHDIGRALPDLSVSLIFDVGANRGDSICDFRRTWPNAEIHAFEPVAENIDRLTQRYGDDEHLHCYHLALSDTPGQGGMVLSEQHRLARLERDTTGPAEEPLQPVKITTIDLFCQEHGIDRIPLLKIDTEGHDLRVLLGASGLLESHQIDLVQVEAGMNTENHLHVPFNEFRTELETLHYRLFGLYEQVEEWPTRQPHLRRCNPVFISPRLIGLHT